MDAEGKYCVNMTLICVVGFLSFCALVSSCGKQRYQLEADLRKSAPIIQTCVNHSAADRVQVIQAY